MSGNQLMHTLLNAPILTRPLFNPLIRAASSFKVASAFKISWISGNTLWPLGVSLTPLLLLTNSENPKSFSKLLIEWLIAEGVTCNCLAAAINVFCLATSLKTS